VTRHLLHALALLYALTAAALLRTALTTWHHDTPHALLYAGAGMLLALATVHHTYQRDELRAAHARIEALSRPSGPHPDAVADEIALGWQQLAEACCLRWWESGGRDDEHDPATCTRKDQTL
jgi:hypothetical protein